MGRIQGLSELPFGPGDVLVRSGPGYLFSITVSWAGAAAGDKLTIRDGTDSSAPFMVPIVLESANGTWSREWSNGKSFTNGLFLDLQSGSGAQVQGEVTFK